MRIISYDSESVKHQIVQNWVCAGVITPNEAQAEYNKLVKYDPKDLIVLLLESHNMREDNEVMHTFYFVDENCISMN